MNSSSGHKYQWPYYDISGATGLGTLGNCQQFLFAVSSWARPIVSLQGPDFSGIGGLWKVSLRGPIDFSGMGNGKNLVGGGENVSVLTAGFSIFVDAIFRRKAKTNKFL